MCVLSHRTDNGGLGYRCKCTFGFNLDEDGHHCVGKKLVWTIFLEGGTGLCAALGLGPSPRHTILLAVAQDVSLSRHLSPFYTELCLSNMSISWDSPLIPHLGSPGAPFLLCLLPKIFVCLFNYAFGIP